MNYLFEKVNNFAIYLGLETNSQDIKDKKRVARNRKKVLIITLVIAIIILFWVGLKNNNRNAEPNIVQAGGVVKTAVRKTITAPWKAVKGTAKGTKFLLQKTVGRDLRALGSLGKGIGVGAIRTTKRAAEATKRAAEATKRAAARKTINSPIDFYFL